MRLLIRRHCVSDSNAARYHTVFGGPIFGGPVFGGPVLGGSSGGSYRVDSSQSEMDSWLWNPPKAAYAPLEVA